MSAASPLPSSVPAVPENWRPIRGYEGFYEVSDQGRVRGVERVVELEHAYGGSITHHRRGKLLKVSQDRFGWPKLGLCRAGIAKSFGLANLVLETFGGPRPAGMFAGPLDGDKSNCVVGNLMWCSRAARRGARSRSSTRRKAT